MRTTNVRRTIKLFLRRQKHQQALLLVLLSVVKIILILTIPPEGVSAQQSQQQPQLPTWNVPMFSTASANYRQSVCDRHKAFHNGSVELRYALQGLQLHPWFPVGSFSMLNVEDGSIPQNLPGIAVEILDDLADRAKFTWRNSFGVSNIANISSTNKTIDDLLEWTVQTFDLSAAEWIRSKQRISEGVIFLEGWFDASVIMVTTKQNAGADSKLDVWAFLEPFDWVVWVLILVTFFVSGMIYFWMERYISHDADRQQLENQPTETLYMATLSFTGDIKFQPSTDYSRLFTVSLAFWSLLVASAYTANLASFLVIRNTPSLPVDSVTDAVRQNIPICVVEGSAYDTAISTQFASSTANIIRTDPSEGKNGPYYGINNGKCTIAVTSIGDWDSANGNAEINGDCQLEWIGRVFKFAKAGYASLSDTGTLCTSLIRDVLNVHLVEMEEEGVIDDLFEKYNTAFSSVDCNNPAAAAAAAAAGSSSSSSPESGPGGGNDDATHQLTIHNMGGLFIVFYSAAALSICMALVDLWRRKRKEGEDNNSNNLNGEVIRESSTSSQRPGSKSLVLTEEDAAEGINQHPPTQTDALQKTNVLDKLDSLQRELEAIRTTLS